MLDVSTLRVNPKIEQATHDRAAAYYGLCDKVITVSSGLLAVTITFRGSLLSSAGGTVHSPHLLIVAWVALAVTVAAGLLTHLGQVQAQTQAIRAMLAGHIGAGLPNFSSEHAGGLWRFRLSSHSVHSYCSPYATLHISMEHETSNQVIQPTAGRRTASLSIMKPRSVQIALALGNGG